jgi:hypothetical protein
LDVIIWFSLEFKSESSCRVEWRLHPLPGG